MKSSLSRIGRYDDEDDSDKPNGFITRGLDTAIKGFQSDFGLKRDRIMHPGGETEQALAREGNND